ncbi:MAG: hypothetical protein ACOX0B_02900 [Minisyncoccales bacterium]
MNKKVIIAFIYFILSLVFIKRLGFRKFVSFYRMLKSLKLF